MELILIGLGLYPAIDLFIGRRTYRCNCRLSKYLLPDSILGNGPIRMSERTSG